MAVASRFSSLVKRQTPIKDAIALMGSSPSNNRIAGFCVVVDEAQKVVGVMTDGDIRRALSKGHTIESAVEVAANFTPLLLPSNLSQSLLRRKLMNEAKQRGAHFMKYDKLVLVDEAGVFHDVMRLVDILEPAMEDKTVAVYGLGFVGLTLACTLANAGIAVVGIDKDPHKLKLLGQGQAPFYEKGLDSMLSSLAQTNPIRYTPDAGVHAADIHIVSVGSPVGKDGAPDLSALREVSQTIASVLKAGDLVIFRSTVPVGTTRGVILPILESSGLQCGRDFHVAFAPERTVEGNALEELRVLPQIVGGFNRESTSLTARLFRHITNVIVEVSSLEEAELVKLMNNTFRDVVFSFANEVAYICDAYNINAFSAIRAANEGYPRDRIPLPGPGVGGICLSKDPLLYSQPLAGSDYAPKLGRTSRDINRRGPEYVASRLQAFAKATKQPVESLKILVVGLAFKGMPETSDMRDSISLRLLELLPNRSQVQGKDFVVPSSEIRGLGIGVEERELRECLASYDAVFFMNNHYRNNKFNVVDALKERKKPMLFFDGWSMFDWREIERVSGICYATMGYTTPSFAV